MTENKENKYDYAWRYFQLHAAQRISLIRYYIVVLSIYITGSGYFLVKFSLASHTEEIGLIFFSIFFILLTIIFWLLDNRNRTLIHLAENSLRSYEKNCEFEREHKIFIREKSSSQCSIRHTCCFKALFILAILSATFILVYSSLMICVNSH